MRLRTGHGPNDWSDNIPGCHAAVTGHGGALVQGDPGKVERDRAINRQKCERYRKSVRPVDKPSSRWGSMPRCGVMLPVAGEPCFRTPLHAGDHRTAYAMKSARERRRAVA